MPANIYVAVVYIVGTALILSVLLIGLLAWTGERPIPDVLELLATGSLTGLLGLVVNPKARG